MAFKSDGLLIDGPRKYPNIISYSVIKNYNNFDRNCSKGICYVSEYVVEIIIITININKSHIMKYSSLVIFFQI